MRSNAFRLHFLAAFAVTTAACTPAKLPQEPAKPEQPTVAQPAAVVASANAAPVATPANAQQALPDTLDALVHNDDTLTSLRQRLGAKNVVEDQVPGAEGEDFPGWVLFPDDPTRRVYVYLDDSTRRPDLLRILDSESQWRRSDGIAMRVTLAELVARNDGKPIKFSGFGWDYGGQIQGWGGGKLEGKLVAGGLGLCPPEFPGDNEPANYPTGEETYSSTNALAKKYPPVVCEFGVGLDGPTKKP